MNKAIWSGLLVVCAAIFFGGSCDEASPIAPEADPTLTVSTDPQKTDAINGTQVIYTDCSGSAVPVPSSGACDVLTGTVAVTQGNGTTGPAAGVTIVSSNEQVAMVDVEPDGTFEVEAVGPGGADLGFTYQSLSAAIAIRTVPFFPGAYFGDEEILSCEATGEFLSLDACTAGTFPSVGDRLAHGIVMTQTIGSATGVFDLGGGLSVLMTGAIAVDGQLVMPGPFSQAIPGGSIGFSNYEVRLAASTQLVGTYTTVISATGVPGSLTYESTLLDVTRALPLSSSAARLTFGQMVQQGIRSIR